MSFLYIHHEIYSPRAHVYNYIIMIMCTRPHLIPYTHASTAAWPEDQLVEGFNRPRCCEMEMTYCMTMQWSGRVVATMDYILYNKCSIMCHTILHALQKYILYYYYTYICMSV